MVDADMSEMKREQTSRKAEAKVHVVQDKLAHLNVIYTVHMAIYSL